MEGYLTVIGGLIALISLVVRYFIKAVEKKDVQIFELIDKFSTTVTNHIISSNQQRKENTEVMTKMVETIQALPGEISGSIIKGVGELFEHANKK
jgi:hypothetical protein